VGFLRGIMALRRIERDYVFVVAKELKDLVSLGVRVTKRILVRLLMLL
jgi:hypothetical protein